MAVKQCVNDVLVMMSWTTTFDFTQLLDLLQQPLAASCLFPHVSKIETCWGIGLSPRSHQTAARVVFMSGDGNSQEKLSKSREVQLGHSNNEFFRANRAITWCHLGSTIIAGCLLQF